MLVIPSIHIYKDMASVKFYVYKKKSNKDLVLKGLPIQVSFPYNSGANSQKSP